MAGWNFGDVLEMVAREVPASPALIHGSRTVSWAELDRRAGAVGRYIAAHGVGRQGRVAQYLHNTPEYIESCVACFKSSFVPVNTNYRYGADELTYLWRNADVEAVVFCGSYAGTIAAMRSRVPEVKLWFWVDDDNGPCPEWAVSYEDVADEKFGVWPAPDWGRSGDDVIQLYTGGTTGMPKGVLWRQDDLFMRLNTERGDIYPDEPDIEFARAKVVKIGRPHLPAAPLMHGAGLLTCFLTLSRGAPISHLLKRSFDPIDLLDTIERDRAGSLMWVGDAFALPTLAALDAHPGRWELGSLRTIMSSGVMFSAEAKQALLRYLPKVTISDVFGSSETMSLGRSITTADERRAATGSFRIKSNTRIIDENNKDIVPGSGEIGMLAVGGRQPIGYYKDDKKTDAIFRTIDGKRYAVPGDWAVIDADGVVTLIGRGSECINTGGEKVFPDEVETVLKRHAAIQDAVVVGIPDQRFGQRIVAVVETVGGTAIEAEEIINYAKSHLAGYKVPRRIVQTHSIGRGPNGKADLKALRELCIIQAGDPT